MKRGVNEQVLREETRRVRESRTKMNETSANGQVLRGSTRRVKESRTKRNKTTCIRASVEGIDKASQRIKRGERGQVLRG